MRHVLSLFDLTTEEIQRVLVLGAELKAKWKNDERPDLLPRQVMGLLFQKPSLRTRVSFESLMNQLGGATLFLGQDVGWGKREPVQDFMPILTSYLDVLVIRAKSHADVEEAAKYSQCPIINGLTDISHPCQALADIMTVNEVCGGIVGKKVAYIGDANNVAYSLAIACSRLGAEFRIGAPKGYQFDQSFLDQLNSDQDYQMVFQMEDPKLAVKDADAVYTDVWTSMGQEAENEKRLKDFAAYQVNAELMGHANPNAKFLHCLPARRGEEVTTEVIEGPNSAIIRQAENRMHAQKGLVAWLLTEAGVV